MLQFSLHSIFSFKIDAQIFFKKTIFLKNNLINVKVQD